MWFTCGLQEYYEKNNLQKKNVVETSNKKGLEQFASLYKYLSRLPVEITETPKNFQIKIMSDKL